MAARRNRHASDLSHAHALSGLRLRRGPHTDEVIDRGLVFLAECPRCEHRWTSRVPLASERRLHRAGGAWRREAAVSAA